MSADAPDDGLYRKCPVCYGTRKTKQLVRLEAVGRTKDLPFTSPCPFCADGYVLAGATLAEVAEVLAERDELLLALAEASQGSAEEALEVAGAAVADRLEDVDRARARKERRDAR